LNQHIIAHAIDATHEEHITPKALAQKSNRSQQQQVVSDFALMSLTCHLMAKKGN
jgi:hypothetical protein